MSDEHAEERVNRRRTPETRARIRHWSRQESLAGGLALVGIALPIAALVLLALLQHTRSDVIFYLLCGMGGSGVVLLIVAAFWETHAQSRLLEARFADGYRSVGIIEAVIEETTEGASVYTLLIAESSGRARLRRRLDSTMYPSGPGARVGGYVRFRHNTLDQDDLSDVFFVKFLQRR